MESGRPFAAVILDLTVPGGVGGEATVKRLLALDPEVRAILSTGYSSDPILADFGAHGFKAAVRKPCRVQEMAEALNTILTV